MSGPIVWPEYEPDPSGLVCNVPDCDAQVVYTFQFSDGLDGESGVTPYSSCREHTRTVYMLAALDLDVPAEIVAGLLLEDEA